MPEENNMQQASNGIGDREVIYIDGDPDWNKPRIALLITGLLAAIFAARAFAAFDSTAQLGFYAVLIILVLSFGVYVRHKYAHSRFEVDQDGIEVAVSMFRRQLFEWEKIRNLSLRDSAFLIDLKNGTKKQADLAYFTPEAVSRLKSAIGRHSRFEL